jgi:hypothetical protein
MNISTQLYNKINEITGLSDEDRNKEIIKLGQQYWNENGVTIDRYYNDVSSLTIIMFYDKSTFSIVSHDDDWLKVTDGSVDVNHVEWTSDRYDTHPKNYNRWCQENNVKPKLNWYEYQQQKKENIRKSLESLVDQMISNIVVTREKKLTWDERVYLKNHLPKYGVFKFNDEMIYT